MQANQFKNTSKRKKIHECRNNTCQVFQPSVSHQLTRVLGWHILGANPVAVFSLLTRPQLQHTHLRPVTQKTRVGMEDIGGWEEIGGWGRAQRVHYLLFIRNINVFKFCISRHCSFSVTINTVTKLIDHSTPLCVLLVSLFNGVTLLQFDKSPSISNNQTSRI